MATAATSSRQKSAWKPSATSLGKRLAEMELEDGVGELLENLDRIIDGGRPADRQAFSESTAKILDLLARQDRDIVGTTSERTALGAIGLPPEQQRVIRAGRSSEEADLKLAREITDKGDGEIQSAALRLKHLQEVAAMFKRLENALDREAGLGNTGGDKPRTGGRAA